MNNPEKSIVNPTNEFHILRHFKFVDDSYKETLVGQPYWYYDYAKKKFVYSKISKVDIENALKAIGTKFEKNIAGIENPKKLLKIIEKRFQELLLADKISWIEYLGYEAATYTFNYQFFVGQMNCLNIDNISEKDKARIKRVSRSKCVGEKECIINTISGIKLSSTKIIYVEIVKTKELPFYTITTFPDCPSADNIADDKRVFAI